MGIQRLCQLVATLMEGSSAGMVATTGIVASTTIETKRAATEATVAKVPSTTARVDGTATGIVGNVLHDIFGGNFAAHKRYVGAMMSSSARIGA